MTYDELVEVVARLPSHYLKAPLETIEDRERFIHLVQHYEAGVVRHFQGRVPSGVTVSCRSSELFPGELTGQTVVDARNVGGVTFLIEFTWGPHSVLLRSTVDDGPLAIDSGAPAPFVRPSQAVDPPDWFKSLSLKGAR